MIELPLFLLPHHRLLSSACMLKLFKRKINVINLLLSSAIPCKSVVSTLCFALLVGCYLLSQDETCDLMAQ